MANVVREKAGSARKPSAVIVGKQIIDIVSTGMYSAPLMVLREYIQNAVDAIDSAVEYGILPSSPGRINVQVHGATRTLSIEDNGTGVPSALAEEVLCSLGRSTKPAGRNRGFRGIGRLGGIGYCDRLVFETRHHTDAEVTEIAWDCLKLRRILSGDHRRGTVSGAIRRVVEIHTRPGLPDESSHFFRATMHGVHQFHKDELMNPPAIAQYISQVAPVGFDTVRFPYSHQVDAHLADLDGYRTYQVFLNGQAVFRPHETTFPLAGDLRDVIHGVELVDIQGPQDTIIGKGWYARMSYRAAIRPTVPMRGVRIRQGNIEIGNEYFLAEAFSERRFATWHIGELHLNYALKANARRDGFEQSRETESFLEQANRLCRHLSTLCRVSSKQRSVQLASERRLALIEALLANVILVDHDHFAAVNETITSAISDLSKISPPGNSDSLAFHQRIQAAQRAFRRFQADPPYLSSVLDGRSVRRIGQKQLLQAVAKRIVKHFDPAKPPEQLVVDVMNTYMIPRVRHALP